MRGLKAWWNQADEYEWMTAFLRQRGWLRSAQWMMVVVAGSAALVPLTALATQRHPGAALVVVGAGALCIAGWSFTPPPAPLAALASPPTVVTGGYIAIFHSARAMLF